MPEFMLIAALTGIGVALATGPLGAFVIWRRMAYFGDTLAHGALLGVALGIFLQINIVLAIALSSLALALGLNNLKKRATLANDTLLGILSHTSLAAGLVLVSVLSDNRVDLFGFLFGDLLTSTWQDVIVIYVISSIVLATLYFYWRPLVLATIDENIAKIDGIPIDKLNALLVIIIALVIAFAMKVVGILLITALLIIPAATSRHFSKNPEPMALGAALVGCAATLIGLACSYWLDTPAGPSIVLAASLLFSCSLLRNRSFK